MANAHQDAVDNNRLYYYCSLPTFQSLCHSKQLWLSDIRKSNDREELSYGLRQVKHRLDVLLKAANSQGKLPHIQPECLKRALSKDEITTAGSFVAANLQHIYRSMDANRNEQYKYFENRQCLALCLAGKGDLLSQWRGYGNDGMGVAVGFDRVSVRQYVNANAEDAIPGETLRFQPVYYREHDGERYSAGYTKSKLRDLPFLANHYELTRGNLYRENEIALIDRTLQKLLSEYHSIETDASPNESSLRFVAQSCENVIPLLKGPSFYEETEERLYVWANPRQILDHIIKPGTFKGKTEIGTTIRGDHKLATHIALPVIARNKNEQDKDHVTLCRVIIGPRCEASKTEVTTMLRQSGIDEEEIDVAYSQSPYTG